MAQLFMHEEKAEGFEFPHVRSLMIIIEFLKKFFFGHIQACWALL